MQVHLCEFLGDEVQQPGLVEPIDLRMEVEALEDVARGGRERLHIAVEIGADVVLVAGQGFHVHVGRVVKAGAGLAQQEGFGIDAGLLALGKFLQHGGLAGCQHAIEAAQHRERQDHAPVFGLLVVAAQQVGH